MSKAKLVWISEGDNGDREVKFSDPCERVNHFIYNSDGTSPEWKQYVLIEVDNE